jgi:hypothetical protein
MLQNIKDIVINTYEEILDDEKITIGNYYTLTKEYKNNLQYIFRANLKEIIYNKYTAFNGSVANYYIFEEYIFFYKNDEPVNLPAPYYVIPKDCPWTRYVPDKKNSALLSLKFFERKSIEPKLKCSLLSAYPFYKMKKKLADKTSIPEDILKYKIAKYLV